MSQRNHFTALCQIRSWTVDDVLKVLKKHGIEESCEAFKKREMDGEGLLGLTEGKLALWKRDLPLTTIRRVSHLVSDMNATPERFVQAENGRRKGGVTTRRVEGVYRPPPPPPRSETPGSDTGSWDTDFEDDDGVAAPPPSSNGGFLYSGRHSMKPPLPDRPVLLPRRPEGLQKNASGLFSLPKPPTPQLEKLIGNLNLPVADGPEDDDEYQSIDENLSTPQSLGFAPPPPRKLTPTEQPPHEAIRRVSPTPYPKIFFGDPKAKPPSTRPPPPYMISKPPFPLPHSQSIGTGSASTSSEHLNSYPASEGDGFASDAEEYEVIMDHSVMPGEDAAYYLQPLTAPTPPRAGSVPPPDLVAPSSHPPSPPRKKSAEDVSDGSGARLSDKLRSLMKMRQTSVVSNASYNNNNNNNEEFGSREKIPSSDLQKSAFEQKPPPVERPGQRPLPPTPDPSWKPGAEKMNSRRNSRGYTQMPWFHNVDRKRAEELLKNGEDGRFLLRPSMQTQNPLTLTLWYNKRLYNISVRQRADQRYALGTEKTKEQSFSSVEELVQHYQGEQLVLYSGGERTGKTLLTTSPPR